MRQLNCSGPATKKAGCFDCETDSIGSVDLFAGYTLETNCVVKHHSLKDLQVILEVHFRRKSFSKLLIV